MTRRTLIGRRGSFSLEDAARIRRAIESSGSAQCPACRIPMARMVGDNGEGDVWLLQCRVCGRGLVLRGNVAPSRSRSPDDESKALATH